MAVDKIDLFLPPFGKRSTRLYGLIIQFTKNLYEALLRAGKKTRLLQFERTNPAPFVSLMHQDPPEFTLSFNGILPDPNGIFLCDLIKIPHVAYLLDSFHYFLPLMNSSRSVIACHDETSVDFLKNMQFKRAFFLPYGIERELLEAPVPKERPLDVVFIARCLDHEKILAGWKARYPKKWVDMLVETCRLFLLLRDNIGLYDTFLGVLHDEGQILEGGSMDGVDLTSMLIEMEMFSRGKDRVDLLKALKGQEVHLFTPRRDRGKWGRLLGDVLDTIVFHDPVPYRKSYRVMRQAKIILNSTPALKTGVSERVLSGLGCGAAIVSSYSSYFSQFVNENDGVTFYSLTDPEDIRHKIEKHLGNWDKTLLEIESGREKVRKGHTWDHRVQELCYSLDRITDGDGLLSPSKV